MFFWSGCKIGDPVLAEFYCFFEGTQQRVDPVRVLAGENLRCVLPSVIQPGDLVFSCHLTRGGRPLCVVIMSRRFRYLTPEIHAYAVFAIACLVASCANK